MNNGTLVVNFAALSQAKADIEKALGRLQSELDQLERDAGPLLSTWEGDAQAAYLARQTQWRNASTDLSNILREINNALADSTSDYMSTEKKATNLFQ